MDTERSGVETRVIGTVGDPGDFGVTTEVGGTWRSLARSAFALLYDLRLLHRAHLPSDAEYPEPRVPVLLGPRHVFLADALRAAVAALLAAGVHLAVESAGPGAGVGVVALWVAARFVVGGMASSMPLILPLAVVIASATGDLGSVGVATTAAAAVAALAVVRGVLLPLVGLPVFAPGRLTVRQATLFGQLPLHLGPARWWAEGADVRIDRTGSAARIVPQGSAPVIWAVRASCREAEMRDPERDLIERMVVSPTGFAIVSHDPKSRDPLAVYADGADARSAVSAVVAAAAGLRAGNPTVAGPYARALPLAVGTRAEPGEEVDRGVAVVRIEVPSLHAARARVRLRLALAAAVAAAVTATSGPLVACLSAPLLFLGAGPDIARLRARRLARAA